MTEKMLLETLDAMIAMAAFKERNVISILLGKEVIVVFHEAARNQWEGTSLSPLSFRGVPVGTYDFDLFAIVPSTRPRE